MAQSKITLLGLSTFMGEELLFEKLVIPDGIDRTTLIDNILLRGADFEALYPDPEFMRNIIGTWSKKWQPTFEKWMKALSIEYNPLENYDRIEEWTDTGKKSNTGTVNIHDTNTTNSNGTVTNTISAFDSSTFENDSKSDNTGNSSSIGDNLRTDNLNEDSNNVHKGRLHGNIGITTSQQMLQSELDIATWNIYEKITDMFITEFCIAIY